MNLQTRAVGSTGWLRVSADSEVQANVAHASVFIRSDSESSHGCLVPKLIPESDSVHALGRGGLRFSSQPIVRLRVLKDSTSFSTEADSASDVIGTKELSSAPQVFNANVRSSVVLFSGCLVPSKSIARVASCISPSAAVLVLFVISIYSFGAEIFISRLPELDGHCSLGAPLLWRVAP
jgi:hypothetical protein